jgi:hypothetical protein
MEKGKWKSDRRVSVGEPVGEAGRAGTTAETQRSLQKNLPRPFEFERSGTPTAFVLYWRWTCCELLNEQTADFDR